MSEQIRLILEDMIGSDLALRDDVSILDVIDQPLVARELRGIADARERLAAVADAARNSKVITVEGSRIVKITPERREPWDEAQGFAWEQQWFGRDLRGGRKATPQPTEEGLEAEAETQSEGSAALCYDHVDTGSEQSPQHSKGYGHVDTPSERSPRHCQDDCWEQAVLDDPEPLAVQVPMMCTPWGLTPVIVCVPDDMAVADQPWAACEEDIFQRRRAAIVGQVARCLQHEREYGAVPVAELLQQHTSLWFKCHSAGELTKILSQSGEVSPVVVDLLHGTVRLRTEEETLTGACEQLMVGMDGEAVTSLTLSDAIGSYELQPRTQAT